jgi:serine/threonine protein kinase
LQTATPIIYHSQTGRLLANVLLKQRYRIIAPIGRGGMGAVYHAEDTQLGNRKVAIKEMSQSGLSPQEQQVAADAFRQEALLLARLQHRSLPSIFDHFEENGRWYLVMSFIEGETLADYLRRTQSGKLPLSEVLQIGMELCTVLSYLHTQQPAIIFRDLKPSNIMRASDGHIYLIDFGIARHFKPGQAKDTAYYGSMGYAPPEQYGKAQTTPRSDIYSLGVVLYQMLSGHNPSTTPFRFPPLQSYVPTVPTDLATFITSMLELDENKRPVSMLIVNQKLQSLTASPHAAPSPQPPLHVGSSTTLPVFLPPLRSNKTAYQLPLLIALLFVLIGGSFTYLTFSHQTSSSNHSDQIPSHITPTSDTQQIFPTSTTSYPHLASTYKGSIRNTTIGNTATLTLTSIVQNQQAISGNVVIGPGLSGSGPFTGTVMMDGSITFTDIPSDGSSATTITFMGSLQANGSLSGMYTTNDYQQGTWQTISS